LTDTEDPWSIARARDLLCAVPRWVQGLSCRSDFFNWIGGGSEFRTGAGGGGVTRVSVVVIPGAILFRFLIEDDADQANATLVQGSGGIAQRVLSRAPGAGEQQDAIGLERDDQGVADGEHGWRVDEEDVGIDADAIEQGGKCVETEQIRRIRRNGTAGDQHEPGHGDFLRFRGPGNVRMREQAGEAVLVANAENPVLGGSTEIGIDDDSLEAGLGHDDAEIGGDGALALAGTGRCDGQLLDGMNRGGELEVSAEKADGFGRAGMWMGDGIYLGTAGLELLQHWNGREQIGAGELGEVGIAVDRVVEILEEGDGADRDQEADEGTQQRVEGGAGCVGSLRGGGGIGDRDLNLGGAGIGSDGGGLLTKRIEAGLQLDLLHAEIVDPVLGLGIAGVGRDVAACQLGFDGGELGLGIGDLGVDAGELGLNLGIGLIAVVGGELGRDGIGDEGGLFRIGIGDGDADELRIADGGGGGLGAEGVDVIRKVEGFDDAFHDRGEGDQRAIGFAEVLADGEGALIEPGRSGRIDAQDDAGGIERFLAIADDEGD